MVIAMEGGNKMFVSPLPPQHVFEGGDLVHVFEGTGAGNKGVRSVGWFGRVVKGGLQVFGTQSSPERERKSEPCRWAVYEISDRFFVVKWNK